MAQKWAGWLHNPCHLGAPQRFGLEDKIKSGPQVSNGYVNHAAWGGPQRCIVWDRIKSDPQVGLVAT